MNERYSRQILLKEIGEEGQSKLASSCVTVVGAGGLGSSALFCLASAGIGSIKIIDSDTVELSNLNRQLIHTEADIGKNKALSASQKLRRYNSEITVTPVDSHLNEENASSLIAGSDIVLACVDNNETRLALNKVCAELGVPLIDGGVGGFEGYVQITNYKLQITNESEKELGARCEELGVKEKCHCEERSDAAIQRKFPSKIEGCPQGGECDKLVDAQLGAAVSVIGSIMSLQAIKTLLEIETDCSLHYIDLLSMRILPIKQG